MASNMQDRLKLEIKKLILETLNITEIEPVEINNSAPLFGDNNPLGLDSIDALEIIMALQEKYGVRIDDRNLSRVVLQSINSIAEFLDKKI